MRYIIDNQIEIEQILQCLANEELALFPTTSSWIIAVDATSNIAVKKLNNIHQIIDNQKYIIYFSDERMMMQHVASIDLELFNFLDEQLLPTAIFSDQIIGVAENALDNNGAAFTLITANDDFTKTIIKRFRKPLYSLVLTSSISNSITTSFNKIPDKLIKQVNYIKQIHSLENDNFESIKFYKLIDNQYIECCI